jgi:hypothetical protein
LIERVNPECGERLHVLTTGVVSRRIDIRSRKRRLDVRRLDAPSHIGDDWRGLAGVPEGVRRQEATMAKRSKKKAKSAKRARAGKKSKAVKKTRTLKKTKTAKKRKAVAKTKVVKKTRAASKKPASKKKKVKTTKPAKKPRLGDFGNDNCAGERERVGMAQDRVNSLFELLNNPETTEDQKPQIQENINQAETDLEAAQRRLDMCIASFPITIDSGRSS